MRGIPTISRLPRLVPFLILSVLFVGLMNASDSPTPVYADWDSGEDGNHFEFIVSTSSSGFRTVNVKDSASTYEHKSGGETVMFTNLHS
jgi:hypothetical protein